MDNKSALSTYYKCYCNTEVDILFQMDFITVHRAVHQRELSDCLDKGFNKNGGKGQLNARLLLKRLLIGISPLHDIGYIHIVEGGDMCRSLLRTDHMFGNRFPHPIHFDDFNIAMRAKHPVHPLKSYPCRLRVVRKEQKAP